MAWLLQVARLVSHESNMPVEWVTPLGWPVVQPYFRIRSRRVRTVFHDMTIIDESDLAYQDNNTTAPVQHYKQRQALPPRTLQACSRSAAAAAAVRIAARRTG